MTSEKNSLSHFIQKLKQKNQTEKQLEQAKDAIALFYKLIESYKSNSSQSLSQSNNYTKKLKALLPYMGKAVNLEWACFPKK